MSLSRRCSRTACTDAAVATLTYVYAESQAVVGPLAAVHEPHQYDLCEPHAARLTAPRGWEVVRHDGPPVVHQPTTDDLEALADAVREAARSTFEGVEAVRRGHLRVLR
ncbi:MAG TPA: DUF3499 domain-containing protein [Frankiaceae bacterium]|nr:DUF3499 domain-containing protein [Frankiaceae bacterium]